MQAPLFGELDSAKPARSFLENVFGRRQNYPKYSPEDLQQIADRYLTNVGLGENVSFATKTFEEHVSGAKSRVKSFQGLQKAKLPGDELFFKKLSKELKNNNKAAQQISADINEIFKTSDDFTKAQAEYTESAKAFNELVKKIAKERNVQDVVGVIESFVGDGKKAIEQQQKKEVENLNEKFQDQQFKTNLVGALGITSDQVEDVKQELLTDLKNTHKQQIDAFNKSTQDSIRALHNTAAKQRQGLLFIASLHNNDESMNKVITQLANENREKNGPQELEITFSPEKTDILSVSLDQLKFIQLLGGGKIERTIDPQTERPTEPISYKLEMSPKAFSVRYLANDRHKRDLLIMAQAVRASGAPGITMSLEFKNEKVAQERARNAYEACLKAGYPPEKIKIKINNEKIYAHQASEKEGIKSVREGLYAKKIARFEDMQNQAQKTRQDLDKLNSTRAKPASKENIAEIKQELDQLRKEIKAKESAAQQPDQNKSPTSSLSR